MPPATRSTEHGFTRRTGGFARLVVLGTTATLTLCACSVVEHTDRDVAALIAARQDQALSYSMPIEVGADLPPKHDPYSHNPRPSSVTVPEEFAPILPPPVPLVPEDWDYAPLPSVDDGRVLPPAREAQAMQVVEPQIPPASGAVRGGRDGIFTLTDALAYAQRHRREYQSAKEDLYLSALALTLERHLWTPIFAAQLRAVYGNYGEAQNFDQAMRFVADLGVSQRLPYGGEFTANMVSTLIRDVGKSITATEDSTLTFGVTVPLLRGAGHVSQERLIQLERELTYSVRTFERFRRAQLVLVAQAYLDLVREKQRVLDSEDSLKRFIEAYLQAGALMNIGQRSLLDVQRAQSSMLRAESTLENARERFRSLADQFKITVGMPVDEPLGLDDIEDFYDIEWQIEAGLYPVLLKSPAIENEDYSVEAALARRFDLLTVRDRIDDARRGVAISRNALLPDLNWSGSVAFDTDPNQGRLGGFHADRAFWRTELVLDLPLERYAERNELRRSLIDVRRAQRTAVEQEERIRAEVRGAINQIRLADISLRIQLQQLEVARNQAEYAKYRFEEFGDIDNRDLLEAEGNLLQAQNNVNGAKTSRWNALLEFRLATETLRIAKDGAQEHDELIDSFIPRRSGG